MLFGAANHCDPANVSLRPTSGHSFVAVKDNACCQPYREVTSLGPSGAPAPNRGDDEVDDDRGVRRADPTRPRLPREYWERVCREDLEVNRATLDIFDIRIPKPKFVMMPTPLWDQLFKPIVAGQRWIAAGLFDPVRRASGRTPADAPLVEAPGFTAPPRERRGLPMHYVPRHKSLVARAGSLVHTTFSLAGRRPARGRSTAA